MAGRGELAQARPAEFHLKLVAAAAAGLADPVALVDTQRRELLRRLRDAQRAAMAEPDGRTAALLLEGIVLRLQADIRWLEACGRAGPAGADVSRHNDDTARAASPRLCKSTARATGWCARRRRRPRGRRGRDGGGDGAERLRQVHTAASAGRAGPALRRRGLAGRAAHRRAERARAGPAATDRVGFVFQSFHLMEELTAVENVELPALLAGRSPRAARRRADELLEHVGLADRARFLPDGAVRRPAAAGRGGPGAGQRAAVVLADEPTGNLDSAATRRAAAVRTPARRPGRRW